jgi:plasmid maintenance system antidote protein VapI
MSDDQPTLLARALEAQGVAQADVARRSGLSTKHINQLAQGHAPMSVDVALRLEYVLGIDAGEWMAADAQAKISRQRAATTLAMVQHQLEWWRKARDDDLNQIMRLSGERDELRARLDAIARAAGPTPKDAP